jgi:hypothetical protein
MKENNVICSHCGAALTDETSHTFGEQIFCETCLVTLTSVCENCGERIWNDNAEGDEHHILCVHCYDNYYTNCERCGRLIHNDDAYYYDDDDYPYCPSCYHEMEKSIIKSYNYKPEPVFYGSGSLFMGVELEIDKGGENHDNAELILNVANKGETRLYAKHDGSIDYGFELVSNPMTLDYHLNKMNWREVCERALDLGYRSHQTNTCGLHIHVNRSAFGENYQMQDEAIGRVVYFVENHWNELLKFSRRTEANINRWASRYGISTTAKDTYKKAKDRCMGRYVAVNLENHNTIEFRIFRGTLNYATFVATLQLIDEICNCAINMSDKQMEGMSWCDFVAGILPKKSELIEYLKSRRLYVNELPLQAEETEGSEV